jgi:ribose transport system substrate-binding protein
MKKVLVLLTAFAVAACSTSAATSTVAPVAATDTAAPAAATTVPSAAATQIDLASITIAYSGYSTSNTYWNILGKSAATEAAAKGVKFVDITATTNDATIQQQAVDSELSQKPSALIIGSVDNKVFGTSIAKAKAAGIPILAVDTGIDDPYISALIQTDNEGAGKQIGQQICKDSNNKGTVLVLGGTVGAQSGDARQKGVADAVTACGMTADKQNGDWDSVKDVNLATSTMLSTPALTAIFVPHSDGAAAVAKAINDKGKTATIKTYGFDGSAAEITAILAGTEAASIHQDNVGMGKAIVDDAITILQGGTVAKTVLITPVLITKANASTYK